MLESERRGAKIAGALAVGGVLLFVAGTAIQLAGLDSVDTDAERLVQIDENARIVLGQVLTGFAAMMLAYPLYFLFRAAAARAEQVRRGFIALIVIGPLLLGGAQVMLGIGRAEAADKFVAETPATQPAAADSDDEEDDPEEQRAEDAIEDQGLIVASQAVGLPGVLALIFGLIYTNLWALRTGLLTRFWGTLGMAVGASMIFLGLYGVMIWFAVLGLQLLGFWPGPRPPAWEKGTAVPWPLPGQPPDGPGSRGTVEGEGREVTARGGELPEDTGEGNGQPRPSGPPPRKRKRRS